MCNDGFSGDGHNGTCEGTYIYTYINQCSLYTYIYYNIRTIIQILMNAIWRLTNVLYNDLVAVCTNTIGSYDRKLGLVCMLVDIIYLVSIHN